MGRKNKHITNLASHGHGAADMKSRPRLPQSAGWWILLPAVAAALLAGAGIFSSLNAGPAAPPRASRSIISAAYPHPIRR